MSGYKSSESQNMERNRDNVITPFSGHPGANLGKPVDVYQYGLQPGTTTLLAELTETLHATIDQCQPHARAAAAKASIRGYICESNLLDPMHRMGDANDYRRHLLYADPNLQFSVLAIVWQPGQKTAIHGHTAWGAVGILEGNPYCEVFDTRTQGKAAMSLDPQVKLRLHPGDVAIVQPGIDDVHRIGNDSVSSSITLHVYGRDLLTSPRSININFNS